MKLSIVLLVCLYTLTMAAPAEYYNLDEAPTLFEKFVKDYNREYKDENDKQAHFEAFKKSLASINEQNKASKTATFGINKFADYTDEEKKTMFGFKRSK